MAAIKAALLGLSLLSGAGVGCVSSVAPSIWVNGQLYGENEIFGGTPSLALAQAAARGDRTEVRRLVSTGADPNAFGAFAVTPLAWSLRAVNYEGFTALLEQGADPNQSWSNTSSAILYTARMVDPKYLLAALKHGGDPNYCQPVSKERPLFQALMQPDGRTLEVLLTAGADVNAQDAGGWTTPMRVIGAQGNYEIVWRLLQRGADYRLKTNQGKTLSDIMGIGSINPNSDSYLWREKVIEYLRERGVTVRLPQRELPRKKPLIFDRLPSEEAK